MNTQKSFRFESGKGQYSENQRGEKSKRTFEIGKNQKSLQKSKGIVRKAENKKNGKNEDSQEKL